MKPFRLKLMLFCTGIFWFSLYGYVPSLSTYSASLNADAQMVGLIVGSYGFTQMLLRIPLGIWSDAIRKRKPFIQGGMVISVLAALGMLLAKNPIQMLLFRGLSGVAATTWVAFTVLYASYFTGGSAKSIGNISSIMSLGQMMAMLFSGALADFYGVSAPFIISIAAGCVGFVASFGIDDNPPTTAPVSIMSRLLVCKNRTLMSSAALAVMSQFIAFSTIYGFTTTWSKEVLLATTGQLSYLTVIYTAAYIVSTKLAGSYLAQKYSERFCVTIGFALIALAAVLVPASTNVTHIYAIQLLAGLGAGLAAPMLMALSISDTPSDKRGAAMGFFQSIYGIGMFVGPVVAGMIVKNYGLSTNFIIMAVLALLTGVAARVVLKGKAKQ